MTIRTTLFLCLLLAFEACVQTGGGVLDGSANLADAAVLDSPASCGECNTPPADVCADSNFIREYISIGRCEMGLCEYESGVRRCPFGCDAGSCTGADGGGTIADGSMVSDAGIVDGAVTDDALVDGGVPDSSSSCSSCNTPPPDVCADTNFVREYVSLGRCEMGACEYESAVRRCPFGCNAASCVDPCSGVICNEPPASYCVGDGLLRVAALGVCEPLTSGEHHCVYPTEDVSCVYGPCQDNRCPGVRCDTDADCQEPYEWPFCSQRMDDTIVRALNGTCEHGTCLYPEEVVQRCEGQCEHVLVDDFFDYTGACFSELFVYAPVSRTCSQECARHGYTCTNAMSCQSFAEGGGYTCSGPFACSDLPAAGRFLKCDCRE